MRINFQKIISTLFIFVTLLTLVKISFIYAQTPTTAKSKITLTPSLTAVPTEKAIPTTKLDNDVQQLKDKIATKVAELRKESKTVLSGNVTTNDSTTITIEGQDGKTHKITYDETVTKLQSVIKKTPLDIKITDVKKGDYIIAAGLQIEDTLTATVIYVDQQYLVLSGKVSDVNKTDFEITIVTSDKDTLILDIESATKQSILNSKSSEIERSGFSKIHIGDTIHFAIIKPKDSNTTNSMAQRLLIIPQEYFVKK